MGSSFGGWMQRALLRLLAGGVGIMAAACGGAASGGGPTDASLGFDVQQSVDAKRHGGDAPGFPDALVGGIPPEGGFDGNSGGGKPDAGGPGCIPDAGVCGGDAALLCCGGADCRGGICGGQGVCAADGLSCGIDGGSQCCTSMCTNGYCNGCIAEGSSCSADGGVSCCGVACMNGHCGTNQCVADGQPCGAGAGVCCKDDCNGTTCGGVP